MSTRVTDAGTLVIGDTVQRHGVVTSDILVNIIVVDASAETKGAWTTTGVEAYEESKPNTVLVRIDNRSPEPKIGWTYTPGTDSFAP